MPRPRALGVPDRQREIENSLRSNYGGSLTIGDLCDLLHTKERRTASGFMEGLPYFTVGKRKRWRAEDVAKRIYENSFY